MQGKLSNSTANYNLTLAKPSRKEGPESLDYLATPRCLEWPYHYQYMGSTEQQTLTTGSCQRYC